MSTLYIKKLLYWYYAFLCVEVSLRMEIYH